MTRLPRLLLIVALAVPGLVWEWPRPIVRLDAAAFRGRRKAARRVRRSAHPGRFRGGGGVRAQLRLESSPVSSSSATEHPWGLPPSPDAATAGSPNPHFTPAG